MKEYSDKWLFDKEVLEESERGAEFSLEAVVRSAAQRMIQGGVGGRGDGVFAEAAV